MIDDIKPPQKKDQEKIKNVEPEIELDEYYNEENSTLNSPGLGTHPDIRKLETPRYLLIVLMVVLFQNFSDIKTSIVNYFKSKDIVYASTEPTANKPQYRTAETESGKIIPNIVNNHLLVPALSIDVPISWNIPNDPDKTAQAMTQGAIQLSESALPGEGGSIYITGHSSNYAWIKSDYNTIFAHLDKLKNGNLIYLKYKNTLFTYQVTSQEILAADDLSLLDKYNNSTEQLSLVTCWPAGTSDKRLAILAKRI